MTQNQPIGIFHFPEIGSALGMCPRQENEPNPGASFEMFGKEGLAFSRAVLVCWGGPPEVVGGHFASCEHKFLRVKPAETNAEPKDAGQIGNGIV